MLNPALPAGLTLNTTTGIISGTYSGAASSITYTVTGTNSFGSTTASFILNYKSQTEANIQGLTACYYANKVWNPNNGEAWFLDTPAESCSLLESLDQTDTYEDEEHTWPGLDDRFERTFSAGITGYLNIGAAGEYSFALRSSQTGALYFDDATTPLISFSENRETERNATITLTSGRHLIRLYFASQDKTARLRLRYASPAAGLPVTTIDQVVTFVGGHAPSFLEQEDISAFVNGEIDAARPRFSGSYVTSFSIAPALPTGISINPVSGVISGSTSTQIISDFTVTATGPLGSTKKVFKLTVGGLPVNGLSAQYYGINAWGDICQMSSFAASNLQLKAQLVEENINHPEMPTGSAWVGVPGEVFGRFYVVWKGYLHVKTSGDYVFQLNNRDGSRLLVNKNVVINNWGCLNAMTEKEGEITFNNAGYYPIEIQYFSNNQDFGVILKWKKKADLDFALIPNNLLGHIPSASFTYTTQRTTYYRHVSIIGNTPVFFGVNMPSPTFTVSPDLPSGLMLQSTGIISGSPSADAEETEYTVTATSGASSLTTVLTFTVTYVAPPSNISIKTREGQEVTQVTIKQFEEMEGLYLSAQGNPRNWNVQPDLPNGLYIGGQNLRIRGTPTVPLPSTAFTVTASNNGGSISKTIYLTVTGCQYGKFVYSARVDSLAGALVIKQNNQTVYEKQQVTNQQYSVVFCLPQGSYDYSFTCNQQQWCQITLQREDGMIVLADWTRGGRTDTGVMTTEVTAKPEISAPEAPPVLSVRQNFQYELQVTGVFVPLTASPPLPEGVQISFKTITGAFREKGMFTYTITAENEKGRSTVVVTFNVGTCPDNKSLVVLSRSYGRTRESMEIYTMNDELVLKKDFEDSAYSETLCMANAEYRVVMKTARSSGSWTAGQELLVTDSWEDLLASLLLDNGQGEQTGYFTINYAIMDLLEMPYYKDGDVKKGWNTLDFNDNKWPKASTTNFGNFTDCNTVYFRRKFTVDNKNKYPIFAFDLEILDGVIAYINGQEVIRRNLPLGEVTEDTLAIAQYDSLIWRRSSVPTSALKNGENVLAVELHKYVEAADTGIYFDMYASLLSGTCMLRTDRGYATDSQHAPSNRYPPSNAFDKNAETMWRDNNLPVFLQFNYNYDRFEYINKIVLRSGQNFNRNHPKKFEFLGMVDKENGEVLHSVDNRNVFTTSYQTVEFIFPNKKAYSAYQMKIYESNDNGNTGAIAEMMLYTCNIVYCPKEDGWPSIMTGEMTYGACPRNTFGEATRTCVLDAFDPKWEKADTSTCLSTRPSQDSAYIDFKFMVSNCTMSNYDRWVNSRFIDIMRNTLLAKKENINIYLKRDCSDSETVNVCFNVRVTTDIRIAEYVYEQTVALQQDISYLIYQDAPRDFPKGMYFVMAINPILRKPIAKSTIAIIVLLVIVVIVTVGAFIYTQKTKEKNKKVHGSVSRKATLDAIAEKMERDKKEKKGLLGEGGEDEPAV